MISLKNLAKLQKKGLEERLLFYVSEESIQFHAVKKIGRTLTNDELYSVSKCIEAGLGHDLHVVINTAIEEAIS